MDSSTSPDTATQPVPREVRLDTVAAQTAAIDELIGLAQQNLQVFDIDLSQTGWNTSARARFCFRPICRCLLLKKKQHDT